MTEAEILHRLRHGWIGRLERRALEKMLAGMRTRQGSAQPHAYTASAAVPQSHAQSNVQQYDHIHIDGSPAFVRASRAALDVLKTTPSWKWIGYLKGLRESQNTISTAGEINGYCDPTSKTFVVFPPAWRNRAKDYAAAILHEAAHAAHPTTGDTTEDERIAMRIENQGRREMGFMFTFAPENNPTHHVQWEKDWNAKHGAARHA